MKAPKKPKVGTTCPAMINEYYDYKLSGDLAEHCVCSITDLPCLGKIIGDWNDQSSQFFSRARIAIDEDRIKRCPLYGVKKETLKVVLADRADKEYQEKLNRM